MISFSDQPLAKATLVKRYKRFLADIKLPSGEIVTIHCPNTGSMKNCQYPGEAIWYSTSSNPKRKYSRTWELAESPEGHVIGINTGRANVLVKSAIEMAQIPSFEAYKSILREVPYGTENSRIDLLLRSGDLDGKRVADCYVEVKSATLLEETSGNGCGFFPDSVSARASKHLRELAYMVGQGYRAVLVYCVQHTGIQSVAAAGHIDSRYAEEMRAAMAAGVEVMAARFHMSPEGIRFDTMIDYIAPKVEV